MKVIRNRGRGSTCTKIALLVLCLAGTLSRAEKHAPGTYHGYFSENRWGQKVFHHGPYHYFVGDGAAKALQPHVGKPLEIEVLELSQPINPGAGLIQKVGKVTEKGAAQGLTLTATLKSDRVVQGDGVTVQVTLRNGSAEEVKVEPHELALMLVTDSPFSSDKIGYEHPEDRAFWYYSYSYASLDGDAGAQTMQIACHQIEVLGKDKAITSIKPGETFEAEFTVGEKLLPDDYEVFALMTPSYKSPLPGPMSERLAFDVVAKAAAGAAQFFDDGAFRKLQTARARELQAKGRLVTAGVFTKQLERGATKLVLPKQVSPASPRSLREVYRDCSQSVFSLAEVRQCQGCGEIHVTPYGTGFAITADGVLLTNRHLIEQLEPSSRLVASTADGTTYPVVGVLASSQKDDAAAIRIDGSGFKPLPLSVDNPVGTQISVISHPRGTPYSLSEGIVSRLFTDSLTRIMFISAEFAVGSSGAPVLDSSGNVLGMVAFTSPLNDQMILRGCIPSQSLIELVTDADFGSPDKVHDPLATERACLKATFAAMQQLGQQQGKIPQKEFNDRLAALHSVMKHAMERCPDDPIAKQYSKVIEAMNKRLGSQPGEQDDGD